MTANDTQHGGAHYITKKIQLWDYIVANNIGYLEGNAIKYLTRWRDKGGIEDLKKALHYVQKLIEVESAADESCAKVAKDYCLALNSACGEPIQQEMDLAAGEKMLDRYGVHAWAGGECPVLPDEQVLVRLRYGQWSSAPRAAGSYEWEHTGDQTDIIQYQVVR